MENSQTDRDAGDDAKRESASYPYYPLHSALRISEAVKDLGGARVAIQKSVLASHLKEPEKSPVLQQRITSAKCFGLIEGRSAFTLTASSKRYYFPTTESERGLALLEFLGCPAAYGEIIKRFDGSQVPSREILANIFHREAGVPDSWKERTAATFLKSAVFAGALDDAGFLRVRAGKDRPLPKIDSEIAVQSMQTDTAVVSHSLSTPQKRQEVVQSIDSNTWSFTYQGKSVHLITPAELDNSLWEKLQAYVNLLKPTDNK
jgi:hypothetical protein